MASILSIDPSPEIRASIAEVVKQMGFDFEEAADGEQGLTRLREGGYALVIMEAMLPDGEGTEVLEHMRASRDATPVLVLTRIATRSVVTSMLKHGISDWMLKPFQGAELASKITRALAPPQQEQDAADKTASMSTLDILILDDIDNVHTKLKSMLPAQLTTASAVDGQSAMAEAHGRLFRVILIDVELPEAGQLLSQLRTLQPQAACLALALRGATGHRREGFDGVLHKPFAADELEEFLQAHFDNQELVTHEEYCVKIGGFVGAEHRLEKYFERAGELAAGAFEHIAAACYDQTIVDLTLLPDRPERLPKFIQALRSSSEKLGLALRLVGSPELKSLLATFDETNTVLVCTSLEEARNIKVEP